MIGQLCTCDVENFGDILYPIIFQKMAERHGITSPIVPFGFFEGAAPGESGYEVRAISRMLRAREQTITHLVVGGGDLLRTDLNVLASHYDSIVAQRIRHSFWLRMGKIISGRKRIHRACNKKSMGYSSVAPFILDKAIQLQIGQVLYCSCGAPFQFPPEKFHAIQEAFSAAAFVYVRDFQSRDKLRAAGVKREIEVAPDLVVALGDFFDRDKERAKGKALLTSHGVDVAKTIIGFQTCPQPPAAEAELLRQLIALKHKLGVEIVLLPLGYCHGDGRYLQKLGEKSGGLLKYAGEPSVYANISIIAACSMFVGTSMHGNITAFSFGVPHLFGPIAVDKVDGFLEVVGLGADFKLAAWSQLAERYAMVSALPPAYFLSKAAAAKMAVHATFQKLAAILKAADSPGA